MNNKEIIKLLTAVSSIQEDIYDSTDWTECFNLVMITNGFSCIVNFGDIHLWSEEDDDREFDESTDKYEPFEPYLRRVLNEELAKLKMITI